ncbi:hypothetical protein [Leptolyngbya sp. KIOST-1]|nr:hypothetical protein [Leptolyngbya sp. KIOST-1]
MRGWSNGITKRWRSGNGAARRVGGHRITAAMGQHTQKLQTYV